jgi:hypothetical protein
VLAAWALYHAGDFQKAVEAGLAAGGAGITAANKAQAIYANYLEKSEKAKLALFMEVVERAEAQAAAEPKNANAHYLLAYALGPLQPGHQRREGAGAGLRRQGQGRARDGDQAGTPACRTRTSRSAPSTRR